MKNKNYDDLRYYCVNCGDEIVDYDDKEEKYCASFYEEKPKDYCALCVIKIFGEFKEIINGK